MVRKPRHLSPDEARLWEKVVERTDALHPDRPVTPVFKKPATIKKVGKPAPEPIAPFSLGQKTGRLSSTTFDPAPHVADRVARAPVSMDRRAFRKLQRGKLKPEARIDLHGMTLAQAHPTLIGFILRAHSDGLRLVLVITGKGRGGQDREGPVPERRGILRDQVPGWLSSGPCRSAVMQVAQAHQSHGGGGAYYVYLKRAR